MADPELLDPDWLGIAGRYYVHFDVLHFAVGKRPADLGRGRSRDAPQLPGEISVID